MKTFFLLCTIVQWAMLGLQISFVAVAETGQAAVQSVLFAFGHLGFGLLMLRWRDQYRDKELAANG